MLPRCKLLFTFGPYSCVFYELGWYWLIYRLFLIFSVSLCFSVCPLLTLHRRCRGLLLHLVTLNDAHSVGLLWTSDQPVADTSTWRHTTLTRDRQPYSQRDSNRQSQLASGRRPTPLTARPLGSAVLSGFGRTLSCAITQCWGLNLGLLSLYQQI